jgi:beta-lactamase class A
MKIKNVIALLIITAAISSAGTYYFGKQHVNADSKADSSTSTREQAVQSNFCSYKIDRLQGFKYIRPLVYAEPECEGPQYLSLKSQIQNKIQSYKNLNSLVSASVYLRDFDKGNWISVNPDEQYHPASLLKLGLMITFLKMEEKTPGFLNRKLTFSGKLSTTRIQTFNSEQIQPGRTYTIKELLQFMVSYSDNNATNLLHDVMDVEEHKRTFAQLGLVVPDVYKLGYTISARDYSTFLKVLYNAGYLNFEHSEFAFELLTKTDFKNGLLAGLPEGTVVAHKFGEWTDGKSVRQLHESGIIYLNGKAYLLTIMTNGTDVQKLTEVIAGLTKIVFDHLENPAANT